MLPPLVMAQAPVKFKTYYDFDDIKDYFEQLQLLLAMNGVKDDKKVAHLLSV